MSNRASQVFNGVSHPDSNIPSDVADLGQPTLVGNGIRKRARSTTVEPEDNSDSISGFRERLREFANDRDWNQFHTPKNLSMGLAGEMGELMELMQWKTDEAILQQVGAGQDGSSGVDDRFVEALGDEVADVFLYLVRLSDVLGLNIGQCALKKIKKNAVKYPVDLAKGNAKKYDELREGGDGGGGGGGDI